MFISINTKHDIATLKHKTDPRGAHYQVPIRRIIILTHQGFLVATRTSLTHKPLIGTP